MYVNSDFFSYFLYEVLQDILLKQLSKIKQKKVFVFARLMKKWLAIEFFGFVLALTS